MISWKWRAGNGALPLFNQVQIKVGPVGITVKSKIRVIVRKEVRTPLYCICIQFI